MLSKEVGAAADGQQLTTAACTRNRRKPLASVSIHVDRSRSTDRNVLPFRSAPPQEYDGRKALVAQLQEQCQKENAECRRLEGGALRVPLHPGSLLAVEFARRLPCGLGKGGAGPGRAGQAQWLCTRRGALAGRLSRC